MALHYTAPPICEVIFSGSSSPIIVLSEPAIGQVIGLVLGGFGNFRLSWNAFPGALCYNIYRLEGVDTYVIQAQCVTDTFFDLTVDGTYVVTAITLEGEGPFSEPIVFSGGGGGGTSTVNVEAMCPMTSRTGFPGVFMISRDPGDTAGNLTVNFTLTGTAVNGVDYTAVPLSAVIPNGSNFVLVDITPDEGVLLSEKVATITLAPGVYDIGPNNTDVVLLRPPLFRIVDYGGATPLFTPPTDASDGDACEWDGTWNLFDDGTPNDVWWFADSQDAIIQPEATVQGKVMFFTHVSGPFNPNPPGSWQVAIYCLDLTLFQIKTVWEGLKTGGVTPAGTYTSNGAGSDPRASIQIEAFP